METVFPCGYSASPTDLFTLEKQIFQSFFTFKSKKRGQTQGICVCPLFLYFFILSFLEFLLRLRLCSDDDVGVPVHLTGIAATEDVAHDTGAIHDIYLRPNGSGESVA